MVTPSRSDSVNASARFVHVRVPDLGHFQGLPSAPMSRSFANEVLQCALDTTEITETAMNSHKRVDYLTRAGVLKQLSDDEVASVSNAESAERLNDGEEYLDLEHLDLGVQQAAGTSADMGRVLPKKAVHEATWSKILNVVGSAPRRDGAP